ncbi:MAG: cytochrome P460 family protein [Kofleriaceae bacterium]
MIRSTCFVLAPAALASLVLGCGGAAPSPAAPASAAPPRAALVADADEHAFNPCAASAASIDCSTWASWTKVNAARFTSKGHRQVPVDVYVEPAFVAAYRDLGATAPVGLRVVKAQHDAQGQVAALTVMGKMPAGYDPANGDWYYGVYDATGTKATREGKLASCIACHAQAAAHDYLFGAP